MLNKELIIPIIDKICLHIYSSTTDKLYEVKDAVENSESKWQLVEGMEYEYEIIEGEEDARDWTIDGTSTIFINNKKYQNRGKIKTGTYVGTVNFFARNIANGCEIKLQIEVQSSKIHYREDYHRMMTDITTYYTDLVMQQGSPITQKFDVDYDTPQTTLYQKFAFVKSLVLNEIFEGSVHKVISNPVRKWADSYTEIKVESVKRISRCMVRQISSNSNRVNIDNLPFGLSSLPRTVLASQKIDTFDTHENQFIKYILTTLYSFCSSLSNKQNASDQLKAEVDVVCSKISEYLNTGFFKRISHPTQLNIGSPVLQKKEGYRELLQFWLMFDLAAKITWKGGDYVYDAGKKNIAVLYEYWVFFKLRNIIGDIFDLSLESSENLVQLDSDRINLNIRQGKTCVVEGKFKIDNIRLLNVRLFYNRTFNYQSNLDKAGSWTMSMRPDYTLSIWPGEISELKAEEQNTIVHIHFDAKYRLDKILLDDDSKTDEDIYSEINAEKADNEINIYKRGDLLKMHAYKDAIRRTGGAYIIYPGDTPERKRGYHEVIPGLGAFCLTPGDTSNQEASLKAFIKDIVIHFLDRTSQREKIALTNNEIYSQPSIGFFGSFPEPSNHCRSFPDTLEILIACYREQLEYDWYIQNRKYAICIGNSQEGTVSLNAELTQAAYILFYNHETTNINGLYKIAKDCYKIYSSEYLQEIGYPNPQKNQLYIVFDIFSDNIDPELKIHKRNVENLICEGRSYVIVRYNKLLQTDRPRL